MTIFKLSGGGLKPLEGQQLALYEGSFYGYGYSSDPELILVTRLDGQWVYFSRHPYHGEQRESEEHFRDIAFVGSKTYLYERIKPLIKRYPTKPPGWAMSLHSHLIAVLSGQRGLSWSLEDEKMVGVEFRYDGPGDGWSEFERYYPHSISGADTARNVYVSYDFNAKAASELAEEMRRGKLPNFTFQGVISYR